jgi:hypothetical protein
MNSVLQPLYKMTEAPLLCPNGISPARVPAAIMRSGHELTARCLLHLACAQSGNDDKD